MKRKFLLAVATVVLGTLLSAFAMYQATFGPVAPLPEDVTELGQGHLLLPDGYVAAFAFPTGPGRVALVDCGNDEAATSIKAALAARNLTVDAVLVTHGHVDHVAGCKALGAPVMALAAEVPYVTGERAHAGPVPKLAGAHGLDVKVARSLTDGEQLAIGDKTITVLALPGHTPGSAAYLVDGVVYFGDAASAGKDGTVVGPPYIFSDDAAEGARSLRALATRIHGATTFAFAHSAPMPANLALLEGVR